MKIHALHYKKPPNISKCTFLSRAKVSLINSQHFAWKVAKVFFLSKRELAFFVVLHIFGKMNSYLQTVLNKYTKIDGAFKVLRASLVRSY